MIAAVAAALATHRRFATRLRCSAADAECT
jgi:hypothetical protein